MRILVLGSGVIGTSTAHYLAHAGHQVPVVDRQSGPAMETSFANAGEVLPGYSAPWAGPGVPLKAIEWMLDPTMWRWGLSMMRNCTEGRYRVNKARMVRMAEYSRDCLQALPRDIDIGDTAQLSGFGLGLDAPRRETLDFFMNDLFPHGDVSRAEF